MEKKLNPVWLLFLCMSQMKSRHSCLKIVVTSDNFFSPFGLNLRIHSTALFFLSGYFYFLTIIG